VFNAKQKRAQREKQIGERDEDWRDELARCILRCYCHFTFA